MTLRSTWKQPCPDAIVPSDVHIRAPLAPGERSDILSLSTSEKILGEAIMSSYDKGTEVKWDWGNGTGTGKIKERFTEKVTRTLQGSEVTRKASEDEPAYLIEQDDGDEVLKSHSELSKA